MTDEPRRGPGRPTTLPGGGRTMTIAAWAKELGCAPETLRRAVRRRELLATIDPLSRGPSYLIKAVDIAAFLEKRRLRA